MLAMNEIKIMYKCLYKNIYNLFCFFFRKRDGPSKTVRYRGEKRRSEVHENGKIGHWFQVGKIGF